MSAIDVTVKVSDKVRLHGVVLGSAFLFEGELHLLIQSSNNRARSGEMQAVRFWEDRVPEEWYLDSGSLVTVIPSSIEFTV